MTKERKEHLENVADHMAEYLLSEALDTYQCYYYGVSFEVFVDEIIKKLHKKVATWEKEWEDY